MEKYPKIKTGQFTVAFIDRNTGIILDHDFNYDRSDTSQKVYSVHDTLKKAIQYAEQRKMNIAHGNNNVGYFIRDKNENVVLHTDNLTKNSPAPTKTVIINGNNFTDLEGIYDEIDRVLTSELDWKTGHNLNAFNDLLYGGFGVYEYEEQIELVWINSAKSKKELSTLIEGKSLYQSLIEIIKSHNHIVFKEE